MIAVIALCVIISVIILILAFSPCSHEWKDSETFYQGEYKVFVQKCTKCGSRRTTRIKMR